MPARLSLRGLRWSKPTLVEEPDGKMLKPHVNVGRRQEFDSYGKGPRTGLGQCAHGIANLAGGRGGDVSLSLVAPRPSPAPGVPTTSRPSPLRSSTSFLGEPIAIERQRQTTLREYRGVDLYADVKKEMPRRAPVVVVVYV